MSNIKILKWQEKKIYIYVQITVVFKNITNVFSVLSKLFFSIFLNIFATAAKHSLIVVFHKKPLIVCERGVLFLLPFIVG